MRTLNGRPAGRGSVAGLPEWDRCAVMGVVNVTPDSFSDGGSWFDTDGRWSTASMVAAGADLVDVGGESTRPGARRVDEAEELRRVMPVVRELAAAGVLVSVDTMRATVAEQALAAGARLVNDVSGGLADPAMMPAVAAAGVPFVVMHWRGASIDMNRRAVYGDVVAEVVAELRQRLEAVVAGGIDPDKIVARPGPGIRQGRRARPGAARPPRRAARPGPSAAGRRLPQAVPRPGAGRRRRHPAPARQRDAATAAVSALAAREGAWAVRVHQVAATADAVRVARAVEAPVRRPAAAAGAGRGGPDDPDDGPLPDPSLRRGDAVERPAFYDAVETGDLDALERLLLGGALGETVAVVHPGWPVLRGRGHVLRSYALIMANTDYIQFFLTDVEVAVSGDTALVTCTENILSGGPAEQDGSAGALVGGLVVASNVFRRTPDGWRLWSHHGSPVLAGEAGDGEGPGAGPLGGPDRPSGKTGDGPSTHGTQDHSFERGCAGSGLRHAPLG